MQAPRFEHFLQEIFGDRVDEERTALIAFLQRALGYGITGNVSEHIFLLLYGEEGRNGKDTLISILHYVLGNTVGAVSNDVILSSGRKGTPGAAKPHLCSLQGKRIAWASETDKGARFDIGQVKFLTGGGTIPARQLYGKEYAFEPSHLLLLLTNNKPHADSHDKAFWERLCPITFHLRFVEQPAGSLDASAIANWERPCNRKPAAFSPGSCRDVWTGSSMGSSSLQVCCMSGLCTGRKKRRCTTSSPTAAFWPGSMKSAQLFKRYTQWAEDNNITRKMSGTTFGLEMKRTFQQQRNNQGTYFRGIGLLNHSSAQAPRPPS